MINLKKYNIVDISMASYFIVALVLYIISIISYVGYRTEITSDPFNIVVDAILATIMYVIISTIGAIIVHIISNAINTEIKNGKN